MDDQDGSTSAASDLESSAALLRSDSESIDALLHALVEKLSGVPGLTMSVAYGDRRLRRLIGDIPYVNDRRRKSDPIRIVVVTVGSCDYWVRADEGSMECGTDRTSPQEGKVTDALPFPQWADALFNDIIRQNHVNHEAIAALRSLIEYNPS
jgi:hypothetical protein